VNMIYQGMTLEEEFARLGVEMTEDDHFVVLRCGKQESIFSAMGATRDSLRLEARGMAAERRMRDGKGKTPNLQGL